MAGALSDAFSAWYGAGGLRYALIGMTGLLIPRLRRSMCPAARYGKSSKAYSKMRGDHVLLALAATILMSICMTSSAAGSITVASAAGAHLDSDLLKGGGNDDTDTLQRLLDAASTDRPVYLILDGAALVSGLNVYGNTTIECTAGGGLYLKDNSSRAMVRNGHRSRGAVIDEHIAIRGCFLNGNREHQPNSVRIRPDLPWVEGSSNQESDGTFVSGLQFLGVNDLRIQNVTLWNVRAFGALIANAAYVDIRGVTVDHGSGSASGDIENTDGLHFKGPLRWVTVESVKIRVGDDSIAFNANDFETNDITARNDFGPYVGQGPITDVSVDNVQLMDSAYGIRILSTNERIDRIVIRNIVGTIKLGHMLNIGHWMNPGSFGNVGRISMENVMVDRPAAPAPDRETLVLGRHNRSKEWYGEANGEGFPVVNYPLININAHIESLRITHMVTQVADERPLLRFGPDTKIVTADIDLSANDPTLSGQIMKLDSGFQIERLNFALDWRGKISHTGKDPIVSRGGCIGQLNWVNTPRFSGNHCN